MKFIACLVIFARSVCMDDSLKHPYDGLLLGNGLPIAHVEDPGGLGKRNFGVLEEDASPSGAGESTEIAKETCRSCSEVCNICNKKFRYLFSHMVSVHNAESNYSCAESGCLVKGGPKYLPSAVSLFRHNVNNHGEKSDIQCEYCKTYFASTSDLDNHQKKLYCKEADVGLWVIPAAKRFKNISCSWTDSHELAGGASKKQRTGGVSGTDYAAEADAEIEAGNVHQFESVEEAAAWSNLPTELAGGVSKKQRTSGGGTDYPAEVDAVVEIYGVVEEGSYKCVPGVCEACNSKRFANLRFHMISKHNHASPHLCNNPSCRVAGEPKYFPLPSFLKAHNVNSHGQESEYRCEYCGKYFPAISLLDRHEPGCKKKSRS